jgi:hypothetical protein
MVDISNIPTLARLSPLFFILDPLEGFYQYFFLLFFIGTFFPPVIFLLNNKKPTEKFFSVKNLRISFLSAIKKKRKQPGKKKRSVLL